MVDNPLLTPSPLPYGLPPYDTITAADYLPAFEAGFAEQLAEVDAIVANPRPPTFDNSVVALERSGQTLRRTSLAFFTVASAHATQEIQDIQVEIAPKLAAHADAIHLNRRLFDRLNAIDPAGLDAESKWLLSRYRTEFARAGVELADAEQRRLRALNAELSELSTEFGKRLLAEMNECAVVVDDVDELAGAAKDAIDAAAAAAAERGLSGKYLIELVLPTGQPLLAVSHNRDLRRRLFDASIHRGSRGNEHDTSAIVTKLAALRAERAGLLGYPTHADYVIADETAGSAKAARAMLESLVPAAVANARADAQRLRAISEDGTLQPWDWAFYEQRLRAQLLDIDDAELRQYFELNRVLHDGVFFAAGQLYGITFTERHDLPTYHPTVRVFEVRNADGSELGLFLADYYTRTEKRGGAWMNEIVEQSGLFGTHAVVVNNLNISPPPQGKPTLLTFDEVRTMFHEFGHALHGLFSNVRYPLFSGTNVPRDFVEYPSQVNEMWALWPEVLANYAKHHATDEPLPEEIADKLRSIRQFGQGFSTVEYLAAALLDLAWHEIESDSPEITDVAEFEADALRAAGVAVPEIPPRYRSTYYNHIFGGGYSAGYYSYIWSEVLDADTVEWFTENGGLRRENGEVFRRELLSKGYSVDPLAAFRAFRGRDPEKEPLLRRRNLTIAT